MDPVTDLFEDELAQIPSTLRYPSLSSAPRRRAAQVVSQHLLVAMPRDGPLLTVKDAKKAYAKPISGTKDPDDQQPNPVGWLSAITFQYFQRVMTAGAARPLETDDLPPLPPEDYSAGIAAVFAAHLKQTGTVGRALTATLWRPYASAALFKLPQDCCVFVSPMLLKLLIGMMEEPEMQLESGLWIVLAILATGLVQTVCQHRRIHPNAPCALPRPTPPYPSLPRLAPYPPPNIVPSFISFSPCGDARAAVHFW